MAYDLSTAHMATLGLAALLTMSGAVSDARRYKIPNIISLALVFLFPFFALTASSPLPWLDHLVPAAILLIAGFVLYTKGFVGAGDVKFLAALGLWAGRSYLLPLLLITAIAGGVLCVVFAARSLTHAQSDPEHPETAPKVSMIPVPYGIAIATGGLSVLYSLSQSG